MRIALLPCLSLAIALAFASSPSTAADGKPGNRPFRLGDKVEHDGVAYQLPLAEGGTGLGKRRLGTQLP